MNKRLFFCRTSLIFLMGENRYIIEKVLLSRIAKKKPRYCCKVKLNSFSLYNHNILYVYTTIVVDNNINLFFTLSVFIL